MKRNALGKAFRLVSVTLLLGMSALSFGLVQAQTPGYIPIWLDNLSQGDSLLQQNGQQIVLQTDTVNYGFIHTDGDVAVGSWVGLNGGWFGTQSNHPLRFFTANGPARMTIDTDGNVGIGIAPFAGVQLDVNGDTVIRTSGSGGNIQFGTPNAETGMTVVGTNRADVRFDGSTLKLLAGAGRGIPPSTSGVAINTAGNVGIGTNNPVVKLDVRGPSGGRAVNAFAPGGTGVNGEGFNGVWGSGTAPNGNGVRGDANNGSNAFGVWGLSSSGFAGTFSGKVQVTGTLTKGGGSFKIDHPLDPDNKYLYHSFVESPDMMNIYNGVTVLDARGEATVTLPEWFETLNRDFRYQLTCIGDFAPVYIAEEIAGNRFKIAGGQPELKVSWQVTGIRQDAWANANRIPVEEDKPASERGFYLHPKLYGQSDEKSIEWAQKPELMRQMKEAQQK